MTAKGEGQRGDPGVFLLEGHAVSLASPTASSRRSKTLPSASTPPPVPIAVVPALLTEMLGTGVLTFVVSLLISPALGLSRTSHASSLPSAHKAATSFTPPS